MRIGRAGELEHGPTQQVHTWPCACLRAQFSNLMDQPCGFTVCGDNRQSCKKVLSCIERGLPAGLGYVRCGDKPSWFIQTKVSARNPHQRPHRGAKFP